jgi:hypothetical protein
MGQASRAKRERREATQSGYDDPWPSSKRRVAEPAKWEPVDGCPMCEFWKDHEGSA